MPPRVAGRHPCRNSRLMVAEPPTDQDLAVMRRQLGRPMRDVVAVAHRCPCGAPDVVTTRPRLSDGTPFPTLYYLTCPRANSAIGTLEASGEMRRMQERLEQEPQLAQDYRAAHERYLAERSVIDDVPEIAGTSAGGMPDRVKCLHVLAAQSLAQGPGVNPLGDEVVAAISPWWEGASCTDGGEPQSAADPGDGLGEPA